MRPGSVVEVLPGRQFPGFSAGDTGVVKRIDREAKFVKHVLSCLIMSYLQDKRTTYDTLI